MVLRITSVLVMVVAIGWLTGCGSKQLLFGTEPNSQTAAKLAALEYPVDSPIGGDLDIVLTREGASVRVVNLTAQSYRDVQMWINREYVTIIPVIEIGAAGRSELAMTVGGAIQGATAAEFQPNRYELRNFINKHGEAYPVGGLLNPDRTRKIVLAEIYDPESGQRYRLNSQ